MNTEDKRKANRQAAPNVADVVDQFNEFFGPVKVLAAEDFETGVKFGEFDDDEESNP